MSRRRRGLTREDRALWHAVARTTEPMHGPVPDDAGQPATREHLAQLLGSATGAPRADDAPYKPVYTRTPVSLPPTGASAPAPDQPAVEKRLLRQLARGTRDVDATIDLHGMTQDRARYALLDFLQQGMAAGHRLVLVVTGKGEAGTGILRRNVPRWLRTEPFAGLVAGLREAQPGHGGEGALYVRLRKRAHSGGGRGGGRRR